MLIFVSTHKEVILPTDDKMLVVTPRFRHVINTEGNATVVQYGILSPDCSPLGWYQSILRTFLTCWSSKFSETTFLRFDSEMPVQGIGEIPDHDNSGIFKVDKSTVSEFTKRYPFTETKITDFVIPFTEVGLRNFLSKISCTDDELYIARYAPNITARIISARGGL